MNEDAVLVDEENGLFLLADGMSGPRAGRVASRLAVRKVHAYLKERLAATQDEDILTLLHDAIVHAHEAVQQASIKRRLLSGMGTTLIVLCVRGDRCHISHVGDSRAYRLRQRLEIITTDHTSEDGLDQEVMMRGLFFFKRRRILNQALGPPKSVVCDGHCVDLRDGDVLLLCSDGLTDMLSDRAIEELLGCRRDEIDTAATVLVEAAKKMGGSDNISVILVKR